MSGSLKFFVILNAEKFQTQSWTNKNQHNFYFYKIRNFLSPDNSWKLKHEREPAAEPDSVGERNEGDIVAT